MQHRTSRQHVVDMCRTMLERGYLKATEGNVSVRVPGHRLYAVTPSNYDYDRMRVEDICLVDFDGNHLPDGAGDALAPSIEAGMHANIYRQRPDVNAIVHTHQPYASALAFLRKPIPALTDEQVRFLGREVAIVDYAPSGTGWLARNVQKKVASGDNAFIIANHGIVALGTDPDRAVFNMALLEKVSIAYLLALTSEAGKVYTIPTAIREVAFAKLRSDEKRIAAQLTEAVPPVRVAADETLPSADAAAAEIAAAGPPTADTTTVETPGSESARLGYAITEYLDVDDTMRRLKALVAQPLRGLRHDAMLDVLGYFNHRCRASKEITDRAKKRIPGGVQHNLAFNYPFPLAIEKADGAYLTDRDGNTYIDFLQAGGPTILGSNYGPVNEQVAAVIAESGPVTGLFHEYELKLAEIIHRYMPHVEMYRSLGSGTEAVMAAVRGARAFTGNNMVIKVGGAYHGWSDTMVYGLRVPGTYRMNAKGIPFGATANTREAFPHDLGQLRRKLIENRVRGGTAAVRRVRRAAGLRRGGHRFPDRPRRRRRVLRCHARPDGVRQGRRRRLPDGRRGRRPGRGDGRVRLRPRRAQRRAHPGRRHPVGEPTVLRGRLLRHRRNGPDQRAGDRRTGRRPAHPGAATADRQIRAAVRGVQPGVDRASGVQWRHAAGHAQPAQAAQGEQGP
jgi:glutamate-1-semialdehyde 2,1-aminomutase